MSKATERADQKPARRANETALKGFPKAKLAAAYDAMAKEKATGDKAADSKAGQALKVVELAHTFRTSQKDGIPLDTVVKGWRDNMKVLAMELAVAGNKFAELKEGKDGAAPSAKLTGYGNNVASIARGMIECEIDPAECVTDDGERSYRECRTAVENARNEARRAADAEFARLQDAKALADEAWSELRKAVFKTEHAGLIETLADVLESAKAELLADERAAGEEESEQDEDQESEPNEEVAEAA